MAADLLRILLHTTLAFTGAAMLVLTVRKGLRQQCGPAIAYGAWSVVPVVLAAFALPAPRTALVNAGGYSERVAAWSDVLAMPAVQITVLLLWAVGCAASAFTVLRQQRRFVTALGPLDRCAEGWIARHSDEGPAVVGMFPPRLVLPADFFSRYSADERALMLAHEHTHRRRGDPYANALAALLRCVFWFHPLLRHAERRFRQDQEAACDAAVLRRFPDAGRRYAHTLLKTQFIDSGLPLGCRWHSHPLEERIMLLKLSPPSRRRHLIGVVAITLLASGGACAAWAEQPATTRLAQPDAQTETAQRNEAPPAQAPTPPLAPMRPPTETNNDPLHDGFKPAYLLDKSMQEGESC